MGDLISRDEALTALRDTLKSGGKSKGLRPVTFEMIWAIKSLPSAEPKTGKWRHYEGMLTCLECGAEFYDNIMEYTGDEAPRFCPDCGVNMEVSE